MSAIITVSPTWRCTPVADEDGFDFAPFKDVVAWLETGTAPRNGVPITKKIRLLGKSHYSCCNHPPRQQPSTKNKYHGPEWRPTASRRTDLFRTLRLTRLLRRAKRHPSRKIGNVTFSDQQTLPLRSVKY